ncbi:major capsid protein [Listeria seeligeri]|uniref:major capsid protein n=1 Tax=Listeria seeligeri TaxID=1640 RepID=UPI0016256A52|nr:major capsid protein [Listeria seeligeri]MBC1744503.1 major capsid protein E [Listeria seeligeri]
MAGITHLEELQKPALRGLIDESIELREQTPTFGSRFLPNENTSSTTFAYDIIKSNKHLAAMIGYGSEPPVMDRDAVANKMGELAKIGIKDIITEEDLLALNQSRSNTEHAEMIAKLQRKAINISNAILDRVEVMKLEAIATGKLSYNKNNVKVGFDYGVPSEHQIVLTGANTWDNVDHDALADLIKWAAKYEETNGKAADAILMPREIFALLAKNKVIISEARPNTAAARVSQAEVNEVLAGFALPAIEIVKNRKSTVRNIYTGVDEVIEFYPQNRVVFVSEGVGNFLFGPTVENEFNPGVFVDAYDKKEPIQSILRGVAAGFPIMEDPKLLLFADVK